jgi:16S rRNA processing protein RimM
MNPDDRLLVGRIARAHGNRGQVIVNPETDFPGERFAVGNVIIVQGGDAGTPRRIVSVRFQQGRPIIALEGIETMTEAEALAGADLWMPRSSMRPLPAGTFHRDELVGCEVRDTTDAVVGRVTAVEGPMERSHLVVEGARGDMLIPLNAEICVRVDPAAGVIVVDPPEGLLELNEGRRPPS